MADRMRYQEKETYQAVGSFPSVESLLGRLNQIDVRLRQLEKERSQENYFTGDLRARNKSLLPTMDDVHLKQTLVNRLQLLEAKIHQLNNELHQGIESSYQAISSPTEKQKQIISNNSSRRMVRRKLGQINADTNENQKPKKVCCTLMPKRVLRWMRSCILCTSEDHCCLNSSISDDCETQGIHEGCYH